MMKKIISQNLEEHIRTINGLTENFEVIEQACRIIIEAIKGGNKILVAGNGGSAADAQHLEGELIGRFLRERRAIPALALTTNSSLVTSITNDASFNQIFRRQIEAYAKPGDVFLAISTSGNSLNIIDAIDSAKNMGCKVIGLTGQSGGKMGDRCDILIKVPSSSTPRIQEAHIFIIHTLCHLVEEQFS